MAKTVSRGTRSAATMYDSHQVDKEWCNHDSSEQKLSFHQLNQRDQGGPFSYRAASADTLDSLLGTKSSRIGLGDRVDALEGAP